MHPNPGTGRLVPGDSLGDFMARVYALAAAVEPRCVEADELQRAWPRSCRAFRAALERIGGPVWFTAPQPSGLRGPVRVLASLDPASGSVRLRPAPPEEAYLHPSAYRFGDDGSLFS